MENRPFWQIRCFRFCRFSKTGFFFRKKPAYMTLRFIFNEHYSYMFILWNRWKPRTSLFLGFTRFILFDRRGAIFANIRLLESTIENYNIRPLRATKKKEFNLF